MKLPIALNINTVLVVLAGLGVFVPGIDALSAWLATMHVAWIGTVVRGLGLLSAFCAAAPLVVPKLRAGLASLGMATPPGAQAPWDPAKDNVVPMVQAPMQVTGDAAGKVLPMVADDAKTGNIRPPSKGAATLPGFVWIAIVAALTALAVVFVAGQAHAQTADPQLGTCTASGSTCFAPAVAVSVASYNFSSKNIAAGVTPQVGYGLTYHALVDVGAAIYLGASVGQGAPNNMNLTLLADVANWLRFGPGVSLIQGGSAEFLFFIGTGTNIVGSSAYVKKQEQEAVRADRAVQAQRPQP
jgi:hypothetical protein